MQSCTTKRGQPVDNREPLYEHLNSIVLPKAGIEVKCPNFEASRLRANQDVYLFEELKSRNRFVGKYFVFRYQLSEEERKNSLNHEFSNLCLTREKGFSDYPNRIVRPLSKSEQIDCLLVEDFVRGHDLDYYISKAAFDGQHERLLRKLTLLGHFLSFLHRQTAADHSVHFKESSTYFRLTIEAMIHQEVIDGTMAAAFEQLITEWEGMGEMTQDEAVLVHGDATPTNFFFHPEDGITAIDLERMRLADRVFDIGFLAAELKHHFALRICHAEVAERFIDHFLHAYCEGFSDPNAVFGKISGRNPFYMALGEIRIARNSWLPQKHRVWLIEEALRCLKR